MTAMTDADALAQLDQELDAGIICECPCGAFADRHGTGRCNKPATHYLEVHRFGTCQSAEAKVDPSVNADGDKGAFFCTDCMESGLALAQVQMSRMPERACCPQWPAALGCGRPMASLDDYVPVRRPL